jgi:hypothetical protein
MSTTCGSTNYPFTCSASALISAAQAAIEKAGGTFSGNTSNGNFAISTSVTHVNGTYSINGQMLTVTITSKGFFLPTCDQIQAYITQFINGLDAG